VSEALENTLEQLHQSGLFDAEWYCGTYPDVASSGLEPAQHYLRYGFHMGRDPCAGFSTMFHRCAFAAVIGDDEPVTALARLKAPEAESAKVLQAAYLASRTSGHKLALELAEKHLAPAHRHGLNILRANQSLSAGKTTDWLAALNSYLAHFAAPDLSLTQTGGPLFDRLSAATMPAPITDGPLVSILMPAHNAAHSLERAVRSILEQSWRNIELIIVDDCSSDATPEKLAALAREDARIKLHRNALNVGPYVSKNIALGMATGRWITGHDADDWAHPRRIADHMASVTSGPEVLHPASLTYMVRMQANGSFANFDSVNDFSPDGITRIASISALFEADLLRNKLGYWDTVRVGADSEMIGRATRLLGAGFARLEQIGMICLSSPDTLTQHPKLGVRAADGTLSKARLQYEAIWKALHSHMRAEDLFLPFPQSKRRYAGAFGFDVPDREVAQCLAPPAE